MNWTSLIGRRRPVEIDALRLATLIHQLGEPPSGTSGVQDDQHIVRRIDGESRLQSLDHLLRHPTTLAYVLIVQFSQRPELAERRGTLARRVRQLLANERQQHLPARRRRPWQTRSDGRSNLTLHPFVPSYWQQLDDVLAFLGSRDLVRVAVRPQTGSTPPALSYGLTQEAAELLERDLYPKDRNSMLHLQLCGIIADLLPPLDDRQWPALLQETQRHLDQFKQEEQIPLEQDPLGVLFQVTFQEQL